MTVLTPSEIKQLGKVGVLFGGRSAEREISILSGSGVLQALKSKGIDAHAFDLPAGRGVGRAGCAPAAVEAATDPRGHGRGGAGD